MCAGVPNNSQRFSSSLLNSQMSLNDLLHSHRVLFYATHLAKNILLSDKDIDFIRTSAFFHDIGKTMIDSNLLSAPRRLTALEYETVKLHSLKGYKIAKKYPALASHAYDILHHHECFDGSGYPKNLVGEEIPLNSRILKIADVFDALTSPRPYKSVISFNKALAIMEDTSYQYDPRLLEIFLKTAPIFKNITEEYIAALQSNMFAYY